MKRKIKKIRNELESRNMSLAIKIMNLYLLDELENNYVHSCFLPGCRTRGLPCDHLNTKSWFSCLFLWETAESNPECKLSLPLGPVDFLLKFTYYNPNNNGVLRPRKKYVSLLQKIISLLKQFRNLQNLTLVYRL